MNTWDGKQLNMKKDLISSKVYILNIFIPYRDLLQVIILTLHFTISERQVRDLWQASTNGNNIHCWWSEVSLRYKPRIRQYNSQNSISLNAVFNNHSSVLKWPGVRKFVLLGKRFQGTSSAFQNNWKPEGFQNDRRAGVGGWEGSLL